jgi:hypothetical protein
MNWYYESEGKPNGPVSATELHRLIATGKVTNRCLVWCKGMSDWQPLHSVVLEPPATDAPEPAPSGDFPQISLDPVAKVSAPELPEVEQVMPSWENRGTGGWISAFFNTITEVLTNPSTTFRRLPQSGSWGRPLSYYMLCSTISTVFWVLVLRVSPPPNVPLGVPGMNPAALNIPLGITLAFVLPFSLLIFPIQAVISTAILQASLWLTGAARQGFETSFRIVGYATGTTSLLSIILLTAGAAASLAQDPALSTRVLSLSSYVMMIWGFIILAKAISGAHGISLPRTLLALMLPLLLCCGLGFGFLVFAGYNFAH